MTPAAFLMIAGVIGFHRLTVAPGTAIPSLSEALRLAQPGDTIDVLPGHYAEHHLTVRSPVTILGHGRPVIDGGGEPIFRIQADDVTLDGLSLRNVDPSFTEDRAAIRIDSVARCRITDNDLEATFFAVYAARSSGCLIAGNRIRGPNRAQSLAGNGIHLYATREMRVEHNQVGGHRDGIYLEFARQAIVQHNVSSGNSRYGLHFMFSDSCLYQANEFRDNRAGTAVMYSNWVAMHANRFAEATGSASYGLLLKDIRDARLIGNTFARNTVALSVDGSDRLLARSNLFAGNGWAIRLFASTDAGSFERNTFLNNAFDVSTNSRETATAFRQNYWDRYAGYDLDRDGLGDVPFRPVRLFGLILERYPPAALLLHSLLANMLDAAERVFPVLTPSVPVDESPLMQPPPR